MPDFPASPKFDNTQLTAAVLQSRDQYLDSDAVFGVKPQLIARIEPHDEPTWPDGTPAPARWHRLSYRFAMTSTTNKEPTT